MSVAYQARGGVAVGALSELDSWEIQLIVNLRRWCLGEHGQAQVWNAMTDALHEKTAEKEIRVFEGLIATIAANAHRPMKSHSVDCPCLGADEALVAHIVALSTAGDLREATQVATLLVTAAKAELVVLLAAQVGITAKALAKSQPYMRELPDNVVRLH